jgi:hypothetical protein
MLMIVLGLDELDEVLVFVNCRNTGELDEILWNALFITLCK